MILSEDLYWNIVNRSYYIITWIAFMYILNYLSSRKTSKLRLFISFIICIEVTFIIRYSNLYDIFYIAIYIIGFIFIIINYKTKIKNGVIISCIYWYLVNFLLHPGIAYLLNKANKYSQIENPYLYYMEYSILLVIILIIGITILKVILQSQKLKYKTLKFIFLPILTNLIILIILFENRSINIDNELMSEIQSIDNIKMVIISILLIISSIYISYILDKIIESYRLKIENTFIKDSINKDYNHYLSLKKEQETIKSLHHDMKNHIICIKHMYENNSENLGKYIEEISRKIITVSNQVDTGNAIVDIILNEKSTICKTKGIDLHVNIELSKCNFIEIVDMCTIFSNCIDNAIEACEKIKLDSIPKSINIKSAYSNSMCIIKIENTKINDIKVRNNKILTDKKDDFLHGLGIRNITDTVIKYNGDVSINNCENKFIMKIIIPYE